MRYGKEEVGEGEVWHRDLGKREVYGKLFKNCSGDGEEEDEGLLRDVTGVEDGVAVLL